MIQRNIFRRLILMAIASCLIVIALLALMNQLVPALANGSLLPALRFDGSTPSVSINRLTQGCQQQGSNNIYNCIVDVNHPDYPYESLYWHVTSTPSGITENPSNDTMNSKSKDDFVHIYSLPCPSSGETIAFTGNYDQNPSNTVSVSWTCSLPPTPPATSTRTSTPTSTATPTQTSTSTPTKTPVSGAALLVSPQQLDETACMPQPGETWRCKVNLSGNNLPHSGLHWQIANSPSDVQIDPPDGLLKPGSSVPVTISGLHCAEPQTFTFTGQGSESAVQSRTVSWSCKEALTVSTRKLNMQQDCTQTNISWNCDVSISGRNIPGSGLSWSASNNGIKGITFSPPAGRLSQGQPPQIVTISIQKTSCPAATSAYITFIGPESVKVYLNCPPSPPGKNSSGPGIPITFASLLLAMVACLLYLYTSPQAPLLKKIRSLVLPAGFLR